MTAPVVAELEALLVLAPELVASEVRPILESLRERERKCDRRSCRKPYLMKQLHRRARNYCSDACRVAASRATD